MTKLKDLFVHFDSNLNAAANFLATLIRYVPQGNEVGLKVTIYQESAGMRKLLYAAGGEIRQYDHPQLRGQFPQLLRKFGLLREEEIHSNSAVINHGVEKRALDALSEYRSLIRRYTGIMGTRELAIPRNRDSGAEDYIVQVCNFIETVYTIIFSDFSSILDMEADWGGLIDEALRYYEELKLDKKSTYYPVYIDRQKIAGYVKKLMHEKKKLMRFRFDLLSKEHDNIQSTDADPSVSESSEAESDSKGDSFGSPTNRSDREASKTLRSYNKKRFREEMLSEEVSSRSEIDGEQEAKRSRETKQT